MRVCKCACVRVRVCALVCVCFGVRVRCVHHQPMKKVRLNNLLEGWLSHEGVWLMWEREKWQKFSATSFYWAWWPWSWGWSQGGCCADCYCWRCLISVGGKTCASLIVQCPAGMNKFSSPQTIVRAAQKQSWSLRGKSQGEGDEEVKFLFFHLWICFCGSIE